MITATTTTIAKRKT